MIRRLKVKFVCINMLIVTIMLIIMFFMLLRITIGKMEEQSLRMIQSVFDEANHRGPGIEESRIPHFTAMIDPDGGIKLNVAHFLPGSGKTQLHQAVETAYETGHDQGILWEYNLRYARRDQPGGTKIVFVDVSVEREMVEELVLTCITIGLISYFLFFGVSILLAQWAIRPVGDAWEKQKQFVGDASHELKTPLTVIMTNAELLQEPLLGPDMRQQCSASILAMSRQMRGLVEGLLELSRVDNGVMQNIFSELCLSDLISESVLPFDPMFFEQGMELEISVEPGIRVHGSESHLRQVAEILLDNAVKYGEKSQPVRLTLVRQGRNALLSLSTAGEQISQQDLSNIFHRFYRIDKARSMNQSYGMGLSIAREIVTSHRGRIWAESKNGINTFFVQLPAKPASHSVKTGKA